MSKRFPADFLDRGVVKITDKILVNNIDTGIDEYITVQQLLTALGLMGDVGIGTSIPLNRLHVYHANPQPVIKIEGQLAAGVHQPTIVMKDDRGAAYAGISIRGSRDVGSGGHSIVFATTTNNAAEVAGTLSDRVIIDRQGVAEHNDNAAAILAGLTAGCLYRTADVLKIVH